MQVFPSAESKRNFWNRLNISRAVIIHTKCDSCNQNVKNAGKLFKTGYLWLCKSCRSKRKKRR